MDTKLKRNYEKFGILQVHMNKLYDGTLMICYLTGSPFMKIKTKKSLTTYKAF